MKLSFEIRYRELYTGRSGNLGTFVFSTLEEAEDYARQLNRNVPERKHWPAIVIEQEIERDARQH